MEIVDFFSFVLCVRVYGMYDGNFQLHEWSNNEEREREKKTQNGNEDMKR